MNKFLFLILSLFFISFAEAQVPAPSETYAVIGAKGVIPYSCGSTIATGGTAQPLITSNITNANGNIPSVRGLVIMNIDTTEPLWISFTSTALASDVQSFPLSAATATTFAGAGSYASVTGLNKNPSVVAATTGHKYSCFYY